MLAADNCSHGVSVKMEEAALEEDQLIREDNSVDPGSVPKGSSKGVSRVRLLYRTFLLVQTSTYRIKFQSSLFNGTFNHGRSIARLATGPCNVLDLLLPSRRTCFAQVAQGGLSTSHVC